MALALSMNGLRALRGASSLRPAARRARPLLVRAFKDDHTPQPAAEKQEQPPASAIAPQLQPEDKQQVIARYPYAAYDVMPSR